MTTRKLILRSMKKNIKLYHLYFFSLIFSISLYFIFATLQHDPSIVEVAGGSQSFSTVFSVAGILLMTITAIFTIYASRIFLRRRSQEVGLYQLIGLSKSWVARFLIIENLVLSGGALVLGIVFGSLFSRLFLMVLLNLIEIDSVLGLTFSLTATLQTVFVFVVLIILISVQIVMTVFRSTLMQLFHAEKQSDILKVEKPLISGLMAILGIGLIGLGYYLSTTMLNDLDQLFVNMLTILFSTILGTYLVFRTTIGYFLYRFRQAKNGHLGIVNGLSIAPLMHRLKGNANSLTLITVLSAMTITMVSLSYSLYYSAEADTRLSMPHDFAFEMMEDYAQAFKTELEAEGISYTDQRIEGLRFTGEIANEQDALTTMSYHLLVMPAEQLNQAGIDGGIPSDNEAIYYDVMLGMDETESYPQYITNTGQTDADPLQITHFSVGNAMNINFYGRQMAVSEGTFERLSEQLEADEGTEVTSFTTIQLDNRDDLERASTIYTSLVEGEEGYLIDFYSLYRESLRMSGLFIFVTAFLGLVFLISTGSILYFKQMTEAEQEQPHYRTLRQLGFQLKDIMRGIVRKQLFVYVLPLIIGLIHAIFALNVASVIVLSSIVLPSMIGMVVYAAIYLIFAFITIRYYRIIIKSSM
ncbi:bacitracin transport system permease protein [Amphibacillus marinus]|uniref:Bacitracin transport system permease protein n=1 Tax=Amphibacillus marinus TaxID=872970 RepID=A0A1H8KHB5_9BACI|nr:FtsX-like permease family protein [Amphibacillus marinus]SEN92363.1 bacitracin transport system permease protein [Amphibacillus marinus]